MQVIALSRSLAECSLQSRAILRSPSNPSYSNLARPAASRTYHESRSAANTIPSEEKKLSTAAHPLSIENLQDLDPEIPHTFFSRWKSPYFNLAVEHHLLTYSPPSSRILFTYVNAPCVVIGRNQNPWVECDIRAIQTGTSDGRHVELVRRRSGGGTVFHDEGNLNYTVIVPGEHFERKTHVQMVVDALAEIKQKQDAFRRWTEVKANERNDIVASLQEKYKRDGAEEEEWFKVSGTAFKLTRGRALHHGTLLHSSAYIDSIGSLLRSPARDFIKAKGVESVRSPVTNLWEVKEHKYRQVVAHMVRRSIEQMWRKKYNTGSSESLGDVNIASGNPESAIPELRAGIEELQTDPWRWDQTPGFSFDSKELVIDGRSLQLGFEVKNGLVQSVKASEELQVAYEQQLVGKNIRSLSATGQWRAVVAAGGLSGFMQDTLVQLLERCFPSLESMVPTFGSEQSGKGGTMTPASAEVILSDAKKLLSKSSEGRIELEVKGSNTVVDNAKQAQQRKRSHSRQKDVTPLQQLEAAIVRLSDRLTEWSEYRLRVNRIGERSKSIKQAPHLIRKKGNIWPKLVFDDLRSVTDRVNSSLLEAGDVLSQMRRPVFRAVPIKPRPVKVDAISTERDDASMRMAGILTERLDTEKKRMMTSDPDSGTDACDNEDDEGTRKPGKRGLRQSTEHSADGQKILQAALAMIDEEDRGGTSSVTQQRRDGRWPKVALNQRHA